MKRELCSKHFFSSKLMSGAFQGQIVIYCCLKANHSVVETLLRAMEVFFEMIDHPVFPTIRIGI